MGVCVDNPKMTVGCVHLFEQASRPPHVKDAREVEVAFAFLREKYRSLESALSEKTLRRRNDVRPKSGRPPFRHRAHLLDPGPD